MRLPLLCLSVPAAVWSPAAAAHLFGSAPAEFSWWDVDPAALLLLLATALLYGRGMKRLKSSPDAGGTRRRRELCFWSGWGLLFLVLATPLDALGEQLFTMHMLQHEIMMLAAAPLLVLSRPLSALLRGAPRGAGALFAALARRGPLRRAWELLLLPFSAWTVHLVVLWGWHAPGLFEAGLASTAIHALQHASFLLAALLFWWALLQTSMGGALGVLYLFTTAIHASLLGALLTFSPRVWYASYLDSAPAWGLSALQDQQLGGLIMWMPAGIVFIVAALALLAQVLRSQPAGRSLVLLLAVALAGCGREEVAGNRFPEAAVDFDEAQARAVIRRHGCGSCHHVPGVAGARGQVGPPLTGVAERAYLAGILPNTWDNLLRWVSAAQEVDPDTAMPTLGLSEAEAELVAAYLYTR